MKRVVKIVIFLGVLVLSTQLFAQVSSGNENETVGNQLIQLDRGLERITVLEKKLNERDSELVGSDDLREFVKMQGEFIKNGKAIEKCGKKFDENEFFNLLKRTNTLIVNVTKILNKDYLNFSDKEKEDFMGLKKKQMGVSLMRSRIMLKSLQ